MLYVGLDVHDKRFVVCVLDTNGNEVRRQSVPRLDPLLAFPWDLPTFAIGYEAGCSYDWLHHELTKIAAWIVVAHPVSSSGAPLRRRLPRTVWSHSSGVRRTRKR